MSKQTDEAQTAIDEWQAMRHDVYEYRYNNHILCPNCGYEHEDTSGVTDGEIFSCCQCDFDFEVAVDISVTYSTA